MTEADSARPTLDGLQPWEPMGLATSNEVWAQLRAKCPVAWAEEYGGYWIVSKYADIARVFRENQTFSSSRINNPDTLAIQIPPTPVPWPLVPEEFDTPEFRTYRRIINAMLSPSAVRTMKTRIEHWVTYYIDQFIALGCCDLAADLAMPVPGAVTLEWLGFPQEDWPRIYQCMHDLSGYTPESELRQAAIRELSFVNRRVEEVAADHRAHPVDDAISYILSQEIDGEPISDDIAHGMIWLAIAGGVDTTTSLTTSVLVQLGRDHELRLRLSQEPELLVTATEEFLRVHAPVRAHARTVVQRVELGGVVMQPGDRVMVGEVSACHDEDAFDDAATFRADRFPNRHAAFGLGIHRCPGSHLARAEFTEMITQVLTRLLDFSIDESRAVEYPVGLSGIGGWVEVPATFTPGPRWGAA